LLALAFVAAFLVAGAKVIGTGADDFGIAGLFSTDEQLAGQLVSNMLQAGNLGLSHFYSYGPLDLYAARALLLPYQLVGRADEHAIVIALRLVSLLAGAGCLAVTFVLGTRLWSSWAGVAATAILVSSATFLSWSTTAHPDMLQLLWLLLAIWSATKFVSTASAKSRLAFLLLASAFAALAFATKYSGELLLPVLWVTAGVSRISANRQAQWHTQLGGLVLDVCASIAVFVALVGLIEAAGVHEWRSVLYQMKLEAGLAHTGHLLRAAENPIGWLSVLVSTEVLGPAGFIAGLGVLIAFTTADLRRFFPLRGGFTWERLPLELFTAGYLFFLLMWVGDEQARYALPALPGLALSAGGLMVWLLGRGRVWAAVAALVLALMLLPLFRQTVDFARAQSTRMDNPAVAARVAAGRWIAAQWPGDTSVVADAYSYLPSSFTNVYQSFGLTHDLLQSIRPEVIVTNTAIRNRFVDPDLARQYVDGAAAYQEIAATYTELETGRLACFSMQNRFGPVTIYSRNAGC
jgi:4-amino-4-deoxy-L-arabinose transferase-like glycosyltransferase